MIQIACRFEIHLSQIEYETINGTEPRTLFEVAETHPTSDDDLCKKCKIVFFIAVMFSERNFWFTSNAMVFHFIP